MEQTLFPFSFFLFSFFFFNLVRYIVSGRMFLPHTAISIEVSYVKEAIRETVDGDKGRAEEKRWVKRRGEAGRGGGRRDL